MTDQQLDEVLRLLELCLARVPIEEPDTDEVSQEIRRQLLALEIEVLRCKTERAARP